MNKMRIILMVVMFLLVLTFVSARTNEELRQKALVILTMEVDVTTNTAPNTNAVCEVNGTVNQDISTGIIGNSASMATNTNAITCKNTGPWDNITFFAFYNSSNIATSSRFASAEATAEPRGQWQMRANTAPFGMKTLVLTADAGGNLEVNTDDMSEFDKRVFYSICFAKNSTSDSVSTEFFSNGTSIGGVGAATAITGGAQNIQLSFVIGNFKGLSAGFIGGIDEVMIFNTTLNEEECKQMHDLIVSGSHLEEAVDTTDPIVNTSFNISAPFLGDTFNFTANVTDETALLHANWTINLSIADGGTLFINNTFGAGVTVAQVSNTTTFGTVGVYNFSIRVTDGGNNVVQNSTIITVTLKDIILPEINTTLNNYSQDNIRVNDIMNITANVTDNIGLSFCQIIINQSTNGAKQFFNRSVSGTSDQCSLNFTIDLVRGNVINITIRVNDTGNNFAMNDTIITIINSPPSYTSAEITTTNPTTESELTGDKSGYVDPDSDVQSGSSFKWYLNGVQIPGETTQTLAGAFFNKTDSIIFEATPRDGIVDGFPVNSSPTIIEDTLASITIGINGTVYRINDVVNVSSNVSDADGLSICLIKTNQSGVFVNNTFDLSDRGVSSFCSDAITITVGRGSVINFTVEINDTFGDIVYRNSTKITVSNTAPTCTAGTLNDTTPRTEDTINQTGCSYSDDDGDAQGTSEFEWFLNNVGIAGETAQTLDLSTAGNGNKDDTINGTERPFDGFDFGAFINVSTFATVENTPPPTPTILLPIDGDFNRTTVDYPFEVTYPADVDSDTINISYYINGVLNQTSLTNVTFNSTDGFFLLNVSLSDNTDASPNATINFTIDTTLPTLLTFNITNNTVFGFNVDITVNITVQDTNPFNVTINWHNASSDSLFTTFNDVANTSTSPTPASVLFMDWNGKIGGSLSIWKL